VQRQFNNSPGLTENFFYDNLYRLEHSTLTSAGTTVTNLQMCYDNTGGACIQNLAGMGNITSRSDVASGAAWTYDPAHKHQVTQAGSSSFTYTYDANGNANTRNGSTIGWTSYNYPSSVATAAESAAFDYGPDRQRWRMAYSGPSGNETTYYSTPMFERVVTSAGSDYRHYLYADGRPVMAISRTTAGTVTARSLLLDRQGSISTIVTDSTGAAAVSESFTAFGNRREASTWSGTPTAGELTTMNGVTRQGYTFQTVLGSMGLNHMNGRIEDAVTGRFLSADPYTADANTQTFNRYSYANNNPPTMVDPSGFDNAPPPPPDPNSTCPGDSECVTFTPTPKRNDGGPPTVTNDGPPFLPDITVLTPAIPTPAAVYMSAGMNGSAARGAGSTDAGELDEIQVTSTSLKLKPIDIAVQLFFAHPLQAIGHFLCSHRAFSGGLQMQLNVPAKVLTGSKLPGGLEGQVSINFSSHGQFTWTEGAGTVAGLNTGVLLNLGLQGSLSGRGPDPMGGTMYTTNTQGMELIAAVDGTGVAAGVSGAAGGSMTVAGGKIGFTVGQGIVAGADFQKVLSIVFNNSWCN
jgi:RHS repeat-associated protein